MLKNLILILATAATVFTPVAANAQTCADDDAACWRRVAKQAMDQRDVMLEEASERAHEADALREELASVRATARTTPAVDEEAQRRLADKEAELERKLAVLTAAEAEIKARASEPEPPTPAPEPVPATPVTPAPQPAMPQVVANPYGTVTMNQHRQWVDPRLGPNGSWQVGTVTGNARCVHFEGSNFLNTGGVLSVRIPGATAVQTPWGWQVGDTIPMVRQGDTACFTTANPQDKTYVVLMELDQAGGPPTQCRKWYDAGEFRSAGGTVNLGVGCN